MAFDQQQENKVPSCPRQIFILSYPELSQLSIGIKII